jgi:hypothetical protein
MSNMRSTTGPRFGTSWYMRCWSSHPVAGACGNGSLIHRLGRSPIGTEQGERGIDRRGVGVVLLHTWTK